MELAGTWLGAITFSGGKAGKKDKARTDDFMEPSAS